jgi:hypothetical protein
MNDEYPYPNFDGLEPPLEAAVKGALEEPIPEDAVDRVKARAKLLAATGESTHTCASYNQSRRAATFSDGGEADTARPMFPTHSLTDWKWITRSPVSSISAAAILFFAIGGIVLWFHGYAINSALADFIQPIIDAKTITFNLKTVEAGVAAVGYTKVMVMAPDRVRLEMKIPDRSFNKTQITINDQEHHRMKQLYLIPDEKKAVFFDFHDVPDFKFAQTAYRPFLFLVEIRSQWLKGGDTPKVRRESLGEKEIGGCKAIGYRFVSPDTTVTLWGNPKSGVPIQIVREWKKDHSTGTETFSDIVLNPELDKSLFDLAVPKGYAVETKALSLKGRDR